MTSPCPLRMSFPVGSAFVLIVAAFGGVMTVAAMAQQEGIMRRSATSSSASAHVQAAAKPDGPIRSPAAVQLRPFGARSESESNGSPLVAGGLNFLAPVTYYSGGVEEAGFVAVADVNGDGIPDLLIANSYISNTIGVRLGNGDGTFGPVGPYGSGGGSPMGIVPVDIDGDGKLDLIVINQTSSGDGLVAVLLGKGDGTFRPAKTFDSGGMAGGDLGPNPIAVVDVNGDGKLDVVVANCAPSGSSGCGDGDGAVGVLLGNGDGTFQPVTTYDSGGSPGATGLAVGDLNGDGKVDVIVTNDECVSVENCRSGAIGVLLGNGDGTFRPSVSYTLAGFHATGIATADLNLDGKLDVVVGGCSSANCFEGNGVVTVLLGKGDGTFGAPSGYDSGGRLADGIAVADLTADANLDVVVADTISGSVAVLSGSGDGTLLPAVTFTLFPSGPPGFVYSVAVADVNGDGQLDLLVTAGLNGLNGTVHVLINDTIPLQPTRTSVTSSSNQSIYGQAVTFTAVVSSTAGSPPNGETITFKRHSAILGTAPLNGGMAALTTSSLPIGIYPITASYRGDANFFASTSPRLRQVVSPTTKSPTATTLASSLNPSIYGQKVTWTTAVTTSGSVPPAGKVKFTWGIYTLGTATLNSSGVATLTKSNLNADSYPLTAVYMGDANNVSSTSPVLNQVVTEATSSAKLTSSPNPSASGQMVTFTATITSPTDKPTGPVTFSAGKTVLGTAQLSGGKATFTTSTLATGSTTVTATYSGDSNIAQSSASVAQTVQP